MSRAAEQPDGAAARRAEQALARRAGVLFDAPGRARLAQALSAVAADRGTTVDAVAGAAADGDDSLVQALLDGSTLQETRWFRDEAVWKTLNTHLIPALPEGAWIWSVGCAHGQEAYALAMLAAEAGREDVRVLATDVSQAAVDVATCAVWPARHLRGLDEPRRQRWLRPSAGGELASVPELRERISVRHHNLARDPLPPEAGGVGLLLCRNVLIYVDPVATAAFLDRLGRTLPADAAVLVGAGESLWHMSDAFAAERLGEAYVYRPRSTEREGAVRGTAVSPPRRSARPRSAPRPPKPRPRPPAAAGPDTIPGVSELLRAGEAAMASGDPAAAVVAFRRAAYLRPDHVLAHLQLGLALEAQGDDGAVRAFRAAWSALQDGDPEHVRVGLGGYAVEDLARMLLLRLEAAR